MKKVLVLLTSLLFSPMAIAEVDFGTLGNVTYGAKILSVGYRHDRLAKRRYVRIKVQKNKLQYEVTFDGEDLPFGLTLFNRVGKKINLIKSTGPNKEMRLGFGTRK